MILKRTIEENIQYVVEQLDTETKISDEEIFSWDIESLAEKTLGHEDCHQKVPREIGMCKSSRYL